MSLPHQRQAPRQIFLLFNSLPSSLHLRKIYTEQIVYFEHQVDNSCLTDGAQRKNSFLRPFRLFCLCEMVLLVLHRKRSRFQSSLISSQSTKSQGNLQLTLNPASMNLKSPNANTNTDPML